MSLCCRDLPKCHNTEKVEKGLNVQLSVSCSESEAVGSFRDRHELVGRCQCYQQHQDNNAFHDRFIYVLDY